MINAVKRFLDMIQESWGWIEPFIGIGTAILAVVIWLQTRHVRARLKRGVFGPKVLVNLSGHPVERTEGEWAREFRVLDFLPTFAIDTASVLRVSVGEALDVVPVDIRERLAAGDPNVVLALPGLAPATAFLLAELHGLAGHFPRVTFPLPAKGYVYVVPIELQRARDEARARRRSK